MKNAKRLIFDSMPASWHELQERVAQVFSEMGCEAQVGVEVKLPRGAVELDVFVRDITAVPISNYICECKQWRRKVPKSVVHSFRTVVSELGAHRGFLISSAGFQSGARAAARFTNIDLLSWREFEALMFDRWLDSVTRTLDPLFAWANELMDASNAEELWEGRELTDKRWEEWHEISKRFLLITAWALFHWHSNLGLSHIVSLNLSDAGVLSGGKPVMILDSYRKVVDAAPSICRLARKELEDFWTCVPHTKSSEEPS